MKRTSIVTMAISLAACLAAAQQPGSQAAPPAQAAPQAQAGQAAPAGQPAAKKPPQAKTKDEYDALTKLSDPGVNPDQKIAMVEEFLVRFPQTDFKTMVYRLEMQAYQQKNDFPNMLEFGEKVLKEDPADVLTLIMLTSAIPERTGENDLDKDVKLGKAEDYGKRALAAVDALPKPTPQMPDADWDKARNDARGQVWAALGLIAMQRKQFDAAETAFKKSTTLQLQPDPVAFWRLGLALQGSKKYEEARDALKKSVAAGGVKAQGRDLAADELQRVDEFLKRRQGAPPAAKP